MAEPSILERNLLLNASDWEQRYRLTEAKLKAERPDLWEHVLEMRGPVGEQPITHLPKPGDIIRTNYSPAEMRVVGVHDWGQISFEAKTIERGSTCYLNEYRLENGRLLGRKYHAGLAGHNIYNQGQDEIFILRRAYQVLPHGRRAVLEATPDLFA